MFHECMSALMLMPRSIAPMRHAHRQEKEQRRRKGQFCLTVQSAVAWSELLTSYGKARPEEHASCCNPDKGESKQQVMKRSEPPAHKATACQERQMSKIRERRDQLG